MYINSLFERWSLVMHIVIHLSSSNDNIYWSHVKVANYKKSCKTDRQIHARWQCKLLFQNFFLSHLITDLVEWIHSHSYQDEF